MNERELADAERMLNDTRVRTKPKIAMARAGMGALGLIAFIALATAMLGVGGAFISVLISLGVGINLMKADVRRDVRLRPEGISDVTYPNEVSLLPYADVDSIALVRDDVVVRVGQRTIDLQAGDSGLAPTLHRYLEAHVRAAHALNEERRVATDFLVRVDAAPDYRHAAAPRSALEAIARAKGMPLQLRVDAARSLDLPDDEIGVTEELKQSKAMFE
jgi:hypothetical protein